DDLVCVVGEANAWPYDAATRGVDGTDRRDPRAARGSRSSRERDRRRRDELVHWVAHRPATGESFQLILAPDQPLSPSTSFQIELTEDALRGGAPRSELAGQFARFLRPTDLLCAWGHYGLDLAIAAGLAPVERLDLRAAAHRVAHCKLGSLEGYAASLGPLPP